MKRVWIFLVVIKSVQNSFAVIMIMVSKWSLCDPPVKSYILPIHRNGRGQTGKFRSPNIFWPALESFVSPLSTTYLKTKRADGFADGLRLGPWLVCNRYSHPCLILIVLDQVSLSHPYCAWPVDIKSPLLSVECGPLLSPLMCPLSAFISSWWCTIALSFASHCDNSISSTLGHSINLLFR